MSRRVLPMQNGQDSLTDLERLMPPTSHFDILAAELGAVAGRIERESNLRNNALIADIERRYAEIELRLERLQKSLERSVNANIDEWDAQISDRIAALKDGKDGADGKEGAQGAQGPAGERGETGLQGLQGAQGERGEMGPQGEIGPQGEVGPQGPQGERGADGESIKGEKGEVGPHGEKGETGAQGERGLQGESGAVGPAGPQGLKGDAGAQGPQGEKGALPQVKRWVANSVSYAHDVCTHKGSLYQATKDTGQEPAPENAAWICLASAGRDGEDGNDGEDGRSLTIKDTFDPTQKYEALDVVTLDNRWFVAKHDDPGPCPGAGWKAGPGLGKTGRPGERGPQGPKGDKGEVIEIITWEINPKTYEVAPVMSNGERGPVMLLRDLFAQFQEEAGDAL